MKFHDFSLTSATFPQIHNFSKPGRRNFQIGLSTVSAATLVSRQSGSKQESLYGNSASNIFNNSLVLKKLRTENFNVTREELNAKI